MIFFYFSVLTCYAHIFLYIIENVSKDLYRKAFTCCFYITVILWYVSLDLFFSWSGLNFLASFIPGNFFLSVVRHSTLLSAELC